MGVRSGQIKTDYLRWLESQLCDMRMVDATYWGLVNLMFDKEFVALIEMDKNRIVDGMDLRVEYFGGHIPDLERVSFLEVLICLSRKLAFTAGGVAPDWAWQLIRNLTFDSAHDPLSRSIQNVVLARMDRVINRTYAYDGAGGFFPLVNPDRDQTKVELWYQLNAYVDEMTSGLQR